MRFTKFAETLDPAKKGKTTQQKEHKNVRTLSVHRKRQQTQRNYSNVFYHHIDGKIRLFPVLPFASLIISIPSFQCFFHHKWWPPAPCFQSPCIVLPETANSHVSPQGRSNTSWQIYKTAHKPSLETGPWSLGVKINR